ncbi:hypothetical protein C8Q77DRAFT_692450 [Trametes polyzona]|nr:hypothetical protein C8Q77DRAFT_692450 [Trametes polyzona]
MRWCFPLLCIRSMGVHCLRSASQAPVGIVQSQNTVVLPIRTRVCPYPCKPTALSHYPSTTRLCRERSFCLRHSHTVMVVLRSLRLHAPHSIERLTPTPTHPELVLKSAGARQ